MIEFVVFVTVRDRVRRICYSSWYFDDRVRDTKMIGVVLPTWMTEPAFL